MDAPTGVDPREGPQRGENYIPWEQIEPMLEPGMTFERLADVLLAKIGLRHGDHDYCLQAKGTSDVPFREHLKHGVWVRKTQDLLHLPPTGRELVR